MMKNFAERAFGRLCGLKAVVIDETLLARFSELGIDAHLESDGCRLEDDYTLPSKGQLGSGTFATVQLVQNRQTGAKLAAKKLITTLHIDGAGNFVGADVNALRAEISALSTAHGHPNILRLHAVYQSRVAIHLLTDVCDGGEMVEFLELRRPHGLDASATRLLMIQLLDALAYVHAGPHYLAHRDVKLANIMLRRKDQLETLTLVDFGSCSRLPADDTSDDSCPFRATVGTRFYSSPEKTNGAGYGLKNDVWGAGVVLYMFIVGFGQKGWADQKTGDQMRQGALENLLKESQCLGLTEELHALLVALLTVNIRERVTAKQAHDQLKSSAGSQVETTELLSSANTTTAEIQLEVDARPAAQKQCQADESESKSFLS